MALTPTISRQLSCFIQYEKTRLGQIYNEFICEGVNLIHQEIDTSNLNLSQLLTRKLDNPPINDIGSNRTISWKALGSNWNIEFDNDFISNSVGEEFAALIQIIQSEIALRDIDLHLTLGSINIRIELVETPKAPEQLPSNTKYLWKVFLPVLVSKEPKEKSMHYAAITFAFQKILDELSLLPHEVFQNKFHRLFEGGLGNKALAINAYQRVYRDLVSEKKFNESMRNKFTSELFDLKQFEAQPLSPRKGDSPLYDHNVSINNIKGRYYNCEKIIYLTIKRLVQSHEFNIELKRLRDAGWLDWQITLAIYNNIIDLKTKNRLAQNGKEYATDEEWLEDFHTVFQEIISKDESKTYVEIPIKELIGKNLDIQLNQLSANVLKSFGLENKSRFQNFDALRTFLNERFRFQIDDVEDLSPFLNK